jgi:uncharacterized protein YqgC (DUF456 family)
MRKHVKTGLIYFLILLFLALGIIGLALPFVPQVIFFAIAFILISFEVPWVETKIEKFLAKYPDILSMYLKLKNKLERYFR